MIKKLLANISNCNKCSLRNKRCSPIVYKGPLNADIMLVGEGPGKVEEEQGEPFVGPAGTLLEKIFNSVDMSLNNFILTNCIYCRPIAPEGSEKQNLTPTQEQLDICTPYLKEFIDLVDPKIIIACGRTALSVLFNDPKVRLGHFEGNWTYYARKGKKDINMFAITHPASLLYLSEYPEKEYETKMKVWNYMKLFKDSYRTML